MGKSRMHTENRMNHTENRMNHTENRMMACAKGAVIAPRKPDLIILSIMFFNPLGFS